MANEFPFFHSARHFQRLMGFRRNSIDDDKIDGIFSQLDGILPQIDEIQIRIFCSAGNILQ